MNCQECRDYIDPYFDNELAAGDAIRVQQHFVNCSECRKRLQSRETLRALLGNPQLKFEVPETLPGKVDSSIRSLTHSPRARPVRKYSAPWIYVPLALAAAMTLLFGLLFLNKSGLFDRLNTHSLVDEVVASHVRSMLATHLLDVPSTDQHTVKPWFDGKLKFAPPVHDFADHGFRLIGGRLDYLDNQEIAAVVYQRGKHIINVFVWPAESDVSGSLQSFSRSGYNIIHWNRDGFEWWAVSDVNAADLEGLAELELQGRIGFDSSYS
jgi:anti-sigma factor RsiW